MSILPKSLTSGGSGLLELSRDSITSVKIDVSHQQVNSHDPNPKFGLNLKCSLGAQELSNVDDFVSFLTFHVNKNKRY